MVIRGIRNLELQEVLNSQSPLRGILKRRNIGSFRQKEVNIDWGTILTARFKSASQQKPKSLSDLLLSTRGLVSKAIDNRFRKRNMKYAQVKLFNMY